MTPSPEPLYSTFTCIVCKKDKPVSAFTRNKRYKTGHENRCKECATEYYKNLERKHAEANNLPTAKTCLMCHATKPMDSFYKVGWSADGRHSRCRDCMSLVAAERWENNPRPPEINRRKNKEWRDANKEYVDLKRKIRYEQNREEILKKAKDTPHKNPERRRVIQRDWNHGKWERHATWNCKPRAKKKGVPFAMAPADLFNNEGRLPEFCPIFPNIRLDYNGGPDRRCWPSVDRIVPELGYVAGNVWVISLAANMWKTNGSNPEERRRIIAIMGGSKIETNRINPQQYSLFD